MSVLEQICAAKQEHIRVKKSQTPLAALQERIQLQEPPRGFQKKIRQQSPALIAEIKKASPSKGVIRKDFDPQAIAKAYERAGASCLSVLTDEPYFQGHDDYLTRVKTVSALPVLRKDFMLDPYQIYESRALGADCVLLIMAALSDSQAAGLHALARDLGMDVLVEIHGEDELRRALAFSPDMIGVNNRSLKTLEVTLDASKHLAPLIPPPTLKIAESGIDTNADLKSLQPLGYTAFLVGESLMRQDNIEAAVKKLMTGT